MDVCRLERELNLCTDLRFCYKRNGAAFEAEIISLIKSNLGGPSQRTDVSQGDEVRLKDGALRMVILTDICGGENT